MLALSCQSKDDFLFELKPTDYKGWAHGLKKAGYATNPKYPDLLIKIIEDEELNLLDEKKSRTKSNKETSKPTSTAVVQNGESTNSSIKRIIRNPYYDSPEVKIHENFIKYYVPSQDESLQDIANKFEMPTATAPGKRTHHRRTGYRWHEPPRRGAPRVGGQS